MGALYSHIRAVVELICNLAEHIFNFDYFRLVTGSGAVHQYTQNQQQSSTKQHV